MQETSHNNRSVNWFGTEPTMTTDEILRLLRLTFDAPIFQEPDSVMPILSGFLHLRNAEIATKGTKSVYGTHS